MTRKERILKYYHDRYAPASGRETGFSYFVPADDSNSEKFGIGSVFFLLQLVAIGLFFVAVGNINWYEPRHILIITSYVLFQVPCFFIAERYKGRHIFAEISLEFTYFTIHALLILFLIIVGLRIVT